MEDEFERNATTLFETVGNSKNYFELLYICTPRDNKKENCIITHDSNIINNLLLEKNKFKIEVFKKDMYGLYKSYKILN